MAVRTKKRSDKKSVRAQAEEAHQPSPSAVSAVQAGGRLKASAVRWAEERRYLNAEPRAGGVKFIDVDVEVDGNARITGVARHGKYVVLRIRRGAVTAYVFYELLDDVDKNMLTDPEFLKQLAAVDSENEIIKKRIKELREFADKLEEKLRDLPVEIVATIASGKSHGHVEVRPARYMSRDEFERYTSICRSLGMRFDPTSRVWVYVPEWSQYIIVSYGP
jgi:hypothetical protein